MRNLQFKLQFVLFLFIFSALLLTTGLIPVHAAPCITPGSPDCILTPIKPPADLVGQNGNGLISGNGAADIGSFLNKIIILIFTAAGIIFVFMLLMSAVQWIMSGGNKEAVAAARSRLTWAIIGIILLSLAFVILRVLSTVTGFTFFS